MKRMLQMLAVVFLVIAGLGFVKFQQIQAAMAAGKGWSAPPETVTSVVTTQGRWQGALEAVGSVEPVQGVTLSADLAGVVDKIAFESGSHVSEGQVLVTLDTRQERAQLASAEASMKLAKNNLERSRKLLDNQAIAQAEFDQVEALERQAQAQVRVVEATIQRKTIRAPFAGIAGIRQVNLGQYLESGKPVVPIQSRIPSTLISRCLSSRCRHFAWAAWCMPAAIIPTARSRPAASPRSIRWRTTTPETFRCRRPFTIRRASCGRACT